jgi:hypothetical protein
MTLYLTYRMSIQLLSVRELNFIDIYPGQFWDLYKVQDGNLRKLINLYYQACLVSAGFNSFHNEAHNIHYSHLALFQCPRRTRWLWTTIQAFNTQTTFRWRIYAATSRSSKIELDGYRLHARGEALPLRIYAYLQQPCRYHKNLHDPQWHMIRMDLSQVMTGGRRSLYGFPVVYIWSFVNAHSYEYRLRCAELQHGQMLWSIWTMLWWNTPRQDLRGALAARCIRAFSTNGMLSPLMSLK